MRIGNIDFVAWVGLSDAFENIATLVYHTYNYNGQMNGTLSIQYGDSEEFDMTDEEYETLEKKYPNWDIEKRIDYFYQKICKKQGLMLVTYDQLAQLELLENIRKEQQ